MPKPKGTTGATKMKILAIINQKSASGEDSYGYCIWKSLKEYFFIYLNDSDIRNVYHHLNDLCGLNYLEKDRSELEGGRCLYRMTLDGYTLRIRYQKYMNILVKQQASV